MNSTKKVDCIPRVGQPRDTRQTPLYRQVMDYINSDETEDKQAVTLRKKILATSQGGNAPVLLSEEMLTVGKGWKTKLIRLSALLGGLDYRIVVTVRRPVEALYSYYVERYDYFSTDYPDFRFYIQRSEEAKIYNYWYLHAVLSRLFRADSVEYVQFESITGDNEAVSIINECFGVVLDRDATLNNANIKRQGDKGAYARSRHVSDWIRPLLKLEPLRKLLRTLRVNKALKLVYRQVSDVRLDFRNRLVPSVSAADRIHVEEALRDSNRKFMEQAGINYTEGQKK